MLAQNLSAKKLRPTGPLNENKNERKIVPVFSYSVFGFTV